MARTFSPVLQAEIDKRFGGEPMMIVEIAWNGIDFVAYSDRKLNDEEIPAPLLVSIGEFDSTVVIDGNSDNQSTTVVLNDVGGEIRALINSNDAHLKPVRVYMTFQGLNLNEKVLVFEGQINSEMTWDEAARTFSFSVLSKLESLEAGFTMDDGNFPNIPDSDRNKAWPLVFGSVCNMEVVQVNSLVRGFLADGMGLPDFTLNERLCQAGKILCPRLEIKGDENITSLTGGVAGGQKVDDLECIRERDFEICKIRKEFDEQHATVDNPFTVRGGEDFPQNIRILLKIGDVKYQGIMTGESFKFSAAVHPQSSSILNPDCNTVDDASIGWRYVPGTGSNDTLDSIPSLEDCDNGTGNIVKKTVGGSSESWAQYNAFKAADFIWLPSGSEVILINDGILGTTIDGADISGIVSLLPGTVDQVAAYRIIGDTKILLEVDPALYTVHTSDFGGYSVVDIRMPVPLSAIDEETWENKIYVSFTSSVGPNPADIIEWLVGKYTDLTVDSASFAAVKSSLSKYPAGFYVKSRPQVLELITNIASQSRCATFVRDNVIHIVYLPLEPASIKTLTETDLIDFRFIHTQTEDLKTRHTISWSNGDAGIHNEESSNFEILLKNNVPQYGIFDHKEDYFTLNIEELVKKSATFWMIRRSNTWRVVQFSTPATQLNLEVFDCVTLNIAQFPTTKVIISSTRYNADNNTISFEAWTPIRSGHETQYLWAWPSQQSAVAVFPIIGEENTSGDGSGIVVIPPIGHPIRIGYDPDTSVPDTSGDRTPSDLDDVLPVLQCVLATGNEFSDVVEPIFRDINRLSQRTFAAARDPQQGGGGGGNKDEEDGDDETLPDQNVSCGQDVNGTCHYEVNILEVASDLVDKPGTAACKASIGRPCTGQQRVRCHHFTSKEAARRFQYQQFIAAKELYDGFGYVAGGGFQPYAVPEPKDSNITSVNGPGIWKCVDDRMNGSNDLILGGCPKKVLIVSGECDPNVPDPNEDPTNPKPFDFRSGKQNGEFVPPSPVSEGPL